MKRKTVELIHSQMMLGLLATAAVLSTWVGANQVDPKTIDGNEPDSTPTYESALPESRELCRQPVVVPSSDLYATHTVVVRQNGDTVRMDTTEVWARAKSEERSDDVWVVGICAEDIVDPDTYRGLKNDNVVDTTFR